MRIAILAYPMRVAGGLSSGKNIIMALQRVADEHEYLLLMPAGVGYEEIVKPKRATCHYYRRTAGAWGQMLYELLTVPRQVRAFKPDVVWSLGNFGLQRPLAAQAVILRNAHRVYAPAWLPPKPWYRRARAAVLRRRLQKSLPATQLVFCQTEAMARRFREAYRFDGHVALMPNGVSRFVESGPLRKPEVFERLRDRFVLFCLSKYYIHKNLEVLVDLFREHVEALADVAVITTINGGEGKRAARFLRSLRHPRVRDHILNVGTIPQVQVGDYYRHCDAFILPTLLESFGPYAEVMRFKTPILTSDLDFARDICGPAALYFDPRDTVSIRDAILQLRDSPALRRELAERGTHRYEHHFDDWETIVANAMRRIEALGTGRAGQFGDGRPEASSDAGNRAEV
jgi:glycosyltransferase involved in cell wall biosynthesis